MGRRATGGRILDRDGHVTVRITLDGANRISVPLYRRADDPEVDWLQTTITAHARDLFTRGLLSRRQLAKALGATAERTRSINDGRTLTSVWRDAIKSDLIAKLYRDVPMRLPTFREVAEMWLSGDISKSHTKVKTRQNPQPIRRDFELYVYPECGGLPVNEIRVEHFEAVYASGSTQHRCNNSRILTWKNMTRVMSLCVWPLKLIERRPDTGIAKPLEDEVRHAMIYPTDEAAVCECTRVPIHDRVWFAVMAREGLRVSDTKVMQWNQILEVHGSPMIRVWRVKQKRWGQWILSAGVYDALIRYRELYRPGEPDTARVFTPSVPFDDAALRWREALTLAGITRPELHVTDEERGHNRVRAHDLRGLFVTTAIARELGDGYVRDRTGHTSASLIRQYTADAELLKAMDQRACRRMDEAIPELRTRRIRGPWPSRPGSAE